MSLSNRRELKDVWGAKPTSLSLNEVNGMMRGVLSDYNDDLEEQYRYGEIQGGLRGADIDNVTNKWKKGMIDPVSQEQVEAMIERNTEATLNWIESTRRALEDVGEELPEGFEERAMNDLHFKNEYLIQSADFYRARSVDMSRLEKQCQVESDDDDGEQKANASVGKRKRNRK